MAQYIESGVALWLPNFTLLVEGEDITDLVRENLIHLSLSDFGGSSKQSDQLSFAVVSDKLKLPTKGVKVTVALGFGEQLVNKGTFVVDSTSSGASASAPRIVQVIARSFSKSNDRGHGTLQSQKTRSFSGITLGNLLSTLAGEHGLTAKVPASLASVSVSHVDQLGESDMNLLTRIAGQYGAVSKISHDYWILSPRDAQTTISGHPLPSVTLTPQMCTRWNYRNNSDYANSGTRGKGTIVVAYHDVSDGGKTKYLTAGSGEPVQHYNWPQASREDAESITQGYSVQSQKKLKSMSLTLPATPELLKLTAECKVQATGFGSVEDGDWKISRLEYELAEQGFSVNLELE